MERKTKATKNYKMKSKLKSDNCLADQKSKCTVNSGKSLTPVYSVELKTHRNQLCSVPL
jgi:hypothetical protein